MKKIILLATIICSLLSIQIIVAQNPVATLEHNGATLVFYGQNSFVEAYDASVNGDQLYLSSGYYTPPLLLLKN